MPLDENLDASSINCLSEHMIEAARFLGVNAIHFANCQKEAAILTEKFETFILQQVSTMKKEHPFELLIDKDSLLPEDGSHTQEKLINSLQLSPPHRPTNTNNYADFVFNPDAKNPISLKDLDQIIQYLGISSVKNYSHNFLSLITRIRSDIIQYFPGSENKITELAYWKKLCGDLAFKAPSLILHYEFLPENQNNTEKTDGEKIEDEKRSEIRKAIETIFTKPQTQAHFVESFHLILPRLMPLYPRFLSEAERDFCFEAFNHMIFRDSNAFISLASLLEGKSFRRFFVDWAEKNPRFFAEDSPVLKVIFNFFSNWDQFSSGKKLPSAIRKILLNPSHQAAKSKPTAPKKVARSRRKKVAEVICSQSLPSPEKIIIEPFIKPQIELIDEASPTLSIENLEEALEKNPNIKLWGRIQKSAERVELNPSQNHTFGFEGLNRKKDQTLYFRFGLEANAKTEEFPEIEIKISKIKTSRKTELFGENSPRPNDNSVGNFPDNIVEATSNKVKIPLPSKENTESLHASKLEEDIAVALELAESGAVATTLDGDHVSFKIQPDKLSDILDTASLEYIETNLSDISYTLGKGTLSPAVHEDLGKFIKSVCQEVVQIKEKEQHEAEIKEWIKERDSAFLSNLTQTQRDFNQISRKQDLEIDGWWQAINEKNGYQWNLVWQSQYQEKYINRLKIFKTDLEEKFGIILGIPNPNKQKEFPNSFHIQIPSPSEGKEQEMISLHVGFNSTGKIQVNSNDETVSPTWTKFFHQLGSKILCAIAQFSDIQFSPGIRTTRQRNAERFKAPNITTKGQEAIYQKLAQSPQIIKFARYDKNGVFDGYESGIYSLEELHTMKDSHDPDFWDIEIIHQRDCLRFSNNDGSVSYSPQHYEKIRKTLEEPRFAKYFLRRVFATAHLIGFEKSSSGKEPIRNSKVQNILRSKLLIPLGYMEEHTSWSDGQLKKAWQQLWNDKNKENTPTETLAEFPHLVPELFDAFEAEGSGINYASVSTIKVADLFKQAEKNNW